MKMNTFALVAAAAISIGSGPVFAENATAIDPCATAHVAVVEFLQFAVTTMDANTLETAGVIVHANYQPDQSAHIASFLAVQANEAVASATDAGCFQNGS